MQGTINSLQGVGGTPLLYHSYQWRYAMQHQYPTEPDTSRHFSQIGPSLTLKLQATTALPHFVRRLVTHWGGGCHQMTPNGTNSRSHQELVTSPVTNNGPLTRKIRFVTAPTPHRNSIIPILGCVTKKRIDDTYGHGRHDALEHHAAQLHW